MGTFNCESNSVCNLIIRWASVAACMLVIAGCSSNPTNNQPSAAQKELYEGQPILSYLAENQAKTPKEAITRARQAKLAGDYDRALFEFIRAYELDDQHTGALLEIAAIHHSRNNQRISYLAYLKALSIDPQLAQAHQGSGLILLKKKKYNLAQESFTKAIELTMQQATISQTPEQQNNSESNPSDKPQSSPAQVRKSYNGLGIIYDIKGKYSQARLNYKAALALDNKGKVVLNNLGYSYYLESNWQQAELYFSQALHVDSAYKPAWKNLGLVYARQEKYMPALEALEQVMDTPQAYNDIGYICLLSKRYKQAAYFFREAISANPKYYQVAQQNLTRVKRLLASNPDGKSSL